MEIDLTKIARVAEGKRAKLKSTAAALKACAKQQGRDFGGVFDIALLESYAGECVIREMSKGPFAEQVVLKGGTMMRVWDRSTSRPTRDTDFQLREGAAPKAFEAWLLDTLCSARFAETYGIVAERESLKAQPIKEGVLEGSLRVEGQVWLGVPGKGARVNLTVEVTTGHLPDPEGIEMREVDPLIAKDAAIRIVCARPEYVIADKLHAIVARGKEGTRLKDWRDILHLAEAADVDARRLKAVLAHVFEHEFRGYNPWPSCVEEAPGFTVGYADRDNGDQLDRYWITRRWPELEGRKWEPGRDPTLAEAAEAIGMLTEDWGLCERRSTTSRTSWALRRMGAAETQAAFADAFRDLEAAADGNLDADRLRARLRADPADCFASAMQRASAGGWLRPWMRGPAMAVGRLLGSGPIPTEATGSPPHVP